MSMYSILDAPLCPSSFLRCLYALFVYAFFLFSSADTSEYCYYDLYGATPSRPATFAVVFLSPWSCPVRILPGVIHTEVSPQGRKLTPIRFPRLGGFLSLLFLF